MAARWGTSPARRLEELPQIEPPVNVCRRDPRLPLVRYPGETLSTTRQILLWIRGRQLGGRLHSYGRVLLRSSDHEFKAASHDGRGDDWPISYADVEPYYEGGGVPRNLRDNGESAQPSRREVPGPSWLTKSEQEFKHTVESRWPERHWFPGATRRPTCIGCHWASSPVRPGA
jgi:choline dehydrogenase-like flavoprotein